MTLELWKSHLKLTFDQMKYDYNIATLDLNHIYLFV
jgi:hypothetical protein